jgi:serine/threonine-protein kinase
MHRLGSRYVLQQLLGRGPNGDVWRATWVDNDMPIAVKVLRPELAGDRRAVEEFLREYSVLLALDGPNLVRVHDLVVDGDVLAVAMDLVDGVDLRRHVAEHGPPPPSAAVRIVLGVLDALAGAHAAGIAHGDVKPENILVESPEPGLIRAKLTDFGIAALAHPPAAGSRADVVGTPAYAAPESAGRERPTPAADVYSVGVVLYELFTGRPPFDAAHPTDLLRAHREEPPQLIAGLPPALAGVLGAMLAKSPRRRPPDARAAWDALADAADEDSRYHDLDLDLDRAADSLVPTGVGAGAAQAAALPATAATAAHLVAATPNGAARGAGAGAGAGADPDSGSGFWTAGGGGYVIPAADDGDMVGSSRPPHGGRLRGPGGPGPGPGAAGGPGRGPYDHDAASQTMLAGVVLDAEDPADASTGPLPQVQRVAPATGALADRRYDDRRRRAWVAAAATTGVLVVAGLGGWALVAAPGDGAGVSPGQRGPAVAMPGGGGGGALGLDLSGLPTASPGFSATGAPTPGVPGQPATAPGPGTTSAAPGASPTAGAPPDGGAPPPPSGTAKPTRGLVPNVVGMALTEARKTITGAGFVDPAVSNGCWAGYAAGDVFSQTPSSGRRTFATVIQLDVQDAGCVTLPEVTNMSLAGAKTTLQNAGFTNVVANPATCAYAGTRTVTGMYPWGGTSMLPSEQVTLSATCPDPPPPPPKPAS